MFQTNEYILMEEYRQKVKERERMANLYNNYDQVPPERVKRKKNNSTLSKIDALEAVFNESTQIKYYHDLFSDNSNVETTRTSYVMGTLSVSINCVSLDNHSPVYSIRCNIMKNGDVYNLHGFVRVGTGVWQDIDEDIKLSLTQEQVLKMKK